MTDEIQGWRTQWEMECPLTIAVAFAGWESGADAALRDELKRIRDTGFQAVKVRFDRDNDIEKMAGMTNWRNPDRLFDSAQQAGLRVIAMPGNRPHHTLPKSDDSVGLTEVQTENISAWLRRICGLYREHPALLAWVLEDDLWQPLDTDTASNPKGDVPLWRLNLRLRHINLKRLLDAFRAADPSHPVLTSSPGLLTNDSENKAEKRVESSTGMFGASFRLERDFEVVNGELERPLYTLARVASVLAAPSYPVVMDCTGGTSRYSGERAVTMNDGKMTRMLLLLLAAGMKTVCLDKWKPDKSGPMAGESGLVDWLDQVTPHAQAAGRIAQAVERYHEELWRCQIQAQAHVLLAPGQDPLAALGAARALLNANIPFAFVDEAHFETPSNESNESKFESPFPESSSSAAIVVLPGVEIISESLLTRLKAFVETGGRVVADMPCGCRNERGELLDTRPGSAFEQLFGTSIAGLFCFSNPAVKEAEPPRGQQRADLVPTTAKAGGAAADGPLAFTENRVGKGRAVLVNLSLSRLNAAPALANAQLSLLSYILGRKQTALPGLTECLQLRRMSEQAEHVFLINDTAQERRVEVVAPSPFTTAADAIEDVPLDVENGKLSVTVPANSGRWLRLSR